jgi:hypothetical protein
VRARADWERMSEAPSSKIKLVPLNPSKTKVVGKTGMIGEKKAIRVRLVRETGRTQFLLHESILFSYVRFIYSEVAIIYIYIYIS